MNIAEAFNVLSHLGAKRVEVSGRGWETIRQYLLDRAPRNLTAEWNDKRLADMMGVELQPPTDAAIRHITLCGIDVEGTP